MLYQNAVDRAIPNKTKGISHNHFHISSVRVAIYGDVEIYDHNPSK